MPTPAGASAGVPAQLVNATVRLLAEEGPAAVQARRVAAEIGTSTTAVYHYFGGMPELLRAVLTEGFLQLEAELATVELSDDPIADICRLALAYRAAAHRNPHLYDLMFGLSAPGGYRPAESATEAVPGLGDAEDAKGAYNHLVNAADRAIRAGRLRAGDPVHTAGQLWSVLHGFVTLELSGRLAHLDEGLAHILLPLGTNLLVGLGDDRDAAERSVARAVSDSQSEGYSRIASGDQTA
ncbi:TetR/AcrR family transcriptional regulator [Pseudonocardia acaciae]|uniref:TetR/AcrR family transcriptional regulator n=1 Tax=Pseudonocardia acaciae TaxID=551276 RepID=UPI00048B4CC2|nr:TetR/AcrR family transcriptional regulator [Pseudonocardia acaciae]